MAVSRQAPRLPVRQLDDVKSKLQHAEEEVRGIRDAVKDEGGARTPFGSRSLPASRVLGSRKTFPSSAVKHPGQPISTRDRARYQTWSRP
jgi:hypothetical protein